ncbi:hypothetical protein LCGC14_2001640 [marine sediment metagenome]|uniref:Uncharacterized protein n=1 Tax=marine sediment metagenome TaxID=412755 RepID=A0A0F9F3D2_9ZZZZ
MKVNRKDKMEFKLNEIERIVYIWARYSGVRDSTKEGKHYSQGNLQDLVRRLQRYIEDPNSFEEGFEKGTVEVQER